MTLSIVGFDPNTGEHGIAVASKFLAAAALVSWAKGGVGAVATQSWVNVQFGTIGLQYLEQGMTAEEVLEKLVESDEGRSVRQVGIVDANGNSATYTGKDCHPWAGGITGPNFACQGNILVSEETVKAMADTFQNTIGDLSHRLLQALLAGERAGGDSRGKQSAGLLVVKENGGYGGNNDRYLDLRVDDHPDPVRELIRLHELHQLYFKKSDPVDILPIEGQLKEKLILDLTTLGYLENGANVTEERLAESLQRFQLTENFDERIQQPGFIDRKVVLFMEELIKAGE